MTRHSTTIELAELIEEEFLAHGAGQLDILVDDIVERYRAHIGKTSISTRQAAAAVHQRLPAALNYLWEDGGWHYVPATAFYFATFANGGPRRLADDATEVEIKRCVAGIGRAQARVGLHFFVGEDDWLFVYHFEHGTRNGHGKVKANLDRAIGLAEAGQLSAGAVEQIAAHIGDNGRENKRQVRRLQASAG